MGNQQPSDVRHKIFKTDLLLLITMSGWIYLMKNNVNGKLYVGQTIQKVTRRIKCHFWEALGGIYPGTKLNRAIVKYGPESFTYTILLKCSPEQLDEMEIHYIKEYNTFHEGYNMTTGGKGYSVGHVMDESTKEKIRQFQRKYNTEEIRKKKSDLMKGEKHHQFGKVGQLSKNFGIVRDRTDEEKETIKIVREEKAAGVSSTELSIRYKKSQKTINNWCGPDFEFYGGPTSTNCSIKRQSQNRTKKQVASRAVQRSDGSGSEEGKLSLQ